MMTPKRMMEESRERDIKLDKMHELLKVMAVKLDKLDTRPSL